MRKTKNKAHLSKENGNFLLKSIARRIYHTLVSIDQTKRDIRLIIIFLTFISILYSFISISLHNKFMTFGLDLGYFDEVIWKISAFRFPYSSTGCIWVLEDHFQLILYFLAPLFWIWDNVRFLLIAQSFVMIFAGLPLYILSKKITGSRVFSFGIIFSYVLFIGIQFSILNEFHQIAFAPIFIAILYLSLEKKNWKWFVYSLFFLFIIKEDISLLIGAIGFGLIFRKGYRKLGLITFIFGTFFFFFLVYAFMPQISVKGVYDHFQFGSAGENPQEIIIHSITDPLFFINSMVSPVIKLDTIFKSLFTYAFLPLFSPLFMLIPLFEDFATRFIYAGPQYTKWALVNHHAATGAMLLAISSIYGGSRLINRFNQKYKKNLFIILGILLISLALIGDFIFHGPINSILKPQFYQKEQWMIDNEEVLKHIPQNPDISVAAQNNLLPHITHRESAYRLPYGLNSLYIFVDLHDGPNKYSPLNHQQVVKFVDDLLKAKRYSIVFQKGEAMLLKRNYKTDITKSPYYGNTNYCYYSYEER